jgi:RNA polymerase primary sigma factor
LALENRGIQLIEVSEKKARDAATRRPSPNVRGLRPVDMNADEETPE